MMMSSDGRPQLTVNRTPKVLTTYVEAQRSKKQPTYPADHEPGMRVPKGGSNCAKCEYLKDAKKGLCGNKHFIAWHGSSKIPAPIEEYCSDWFQTK